MRETNFSSMCHIFVISRGLLGHSLLRPKTGETPLSAKEEEKDTIAHHLSTPRGVKKSLKSLPKGLKKSLKSLPKGFRKAANNIKHCKTTADSVPEWLTFYGDDEGSNTEKRA